MFNHIAVRKLHILLEQGLVPNDEVQLCNEKGEIVSVINKYGKVIWIDKEEKRGIGSIG